MTTNETNVTDGAPQAGGMSGVAAPPDEGAREREAVDAIAGDRVRLFEYLATVEEAARGRKERAVVEALVGILALYDRARTAYYNALPDDTTPAPSSPRAEAPEAEPADAAALVEPATAIVDAVQRWREAPLAAQHLHVGRVIDSAHTLGNAIAALRRAAPGAAPEREAPDGWELKCRDCGHSGALHDADGCMAIELHPHRHDCTCKRALATPAPTGERAGGEAGREATNEAAFSALERARQKALGTDVVTLTWNESGTVLAALMDAAHPSPLAEAWPLVEQLERATHMHVTASEPEQAAQWLERRNRARVALHALLTHRAPVAAPRGTEGRDDA